MTGTQLAALIRRKTRTTTSTYTDANMLVDVNVAIEELAGQIQQVRPEIWNMPMLADLVADQREYGCASDMLNNIVSLELKFSSTADYVPATPLKKNLSDSALQESVIVGAYNNYTPFYFLRRKAVYILSGTIVEVTNGFKLVSNIFPATLADLSGVTDLSADPTTTSHGFPREFHLLLADRVSIMFKNMKSMKLDRDELTYDQRLEAKLEEFSIANLDLQETADMPGSASLSNHGFDL